jgi:PBP4 family serine-type D-alanyl-D-alanine carboxypeptidase
VVSPGQPGKPARIALAPESDYVALNNKTKTISSEKSAIAFFRKPETNEITVSGTLPAKSAEVTLNCAIHDPTAYFGTVLIETLKAERVGVSGRIRREGSIDNAKLVFEFESGILESLKVCNTNSQNFYAEMVLKTIGWKKFGVGTRENGVKAISQFLERSGIKGVEQYDGSGLARSNKASAGALVKLLRWSVDNHPELLETLAVSGKAGSLKSRMASIEGKVRAKSGHISGVWTLSGLVENKYGEQFIFSILINSSDDRRSATEGEPDRFADKLVEFLASMKLD